MFLRYVASDAIPNPLWTLFDPMAPVTTTRYLIDIPDYLMTEIIGAISLVSRWEMWEGDNQWFNTLNEDAINRMILSMREAQEMIGTIVTHVRQSLPSNHLLCNGATYNRVDYPDLYAVIHPDLRIDANRFKVPNFFDSFLKSRNGTELVGEQGGANSVALTANQNGPHSHTTMDYIPPGFALPDPVPNPGIPGALQLPSNTSVSGLGSPHENRPKFTTVRYAIVASL